ncbi:MAG: Spy/CpxP family protein refolding chaperone [Methylovulum sp.]|nr:Spy/CpxP family protein refolding chaperone [Methylovulum sp.]
MLKIYPKSILVLTLLPVLALAGPEFGGLPPCEKGGRPSMPHHGVIGNELPPYLTDIDLTQTQKDQIKQLVSAKGQGFQQKWQESFKLKAQIHELPFSSDYTDDKAKALISNSIQTHAQAMLEKSQLDNAIYRLLTSEQKEKLKANRAAFANRDNHG